VLRAAAAVSLLIMAAAFVVGRKLLGLSA
jgi:hypothetical protein